MNEEDLLIKQFKRHKKLYIGLFLFFIIPLPFPEACSPFAFLFQAYLKNYIPDFQISAFLYSGPVLPFA